MYTAEQQRIIDRLNEFIDEQPSQNKAAELLGISAPILTNLRKGTYTGTVDKYMNKLATYFNIKADLGNAYREVEYAHTSISKKVYDTIRICHVKGGLAVYAGDAGIGKTKAAQKYLRDNPDSAVYLSVNPCLTSIKSTLKLLSSKLGAPTAPTLDELWSNIIGKLSDGMVLIFDEAQHLPIKTIETLRSFILIPAGEGRSTGDVGQANALYFLGNGKIEVIPQHNAVCPFFKPGGKGGDAPMFLTAKGLYAKISGSLPLLCNNYEEA